MSEPRQAVVVGAGPVGCLAALALSKRGWRVALYEGRPDPRLPSSKIAARARSINLAISHRGLCAINTIDPCAAQRIIQNVVRMKGRMIHNLNGKLDSQLYDRDGQCINSIDRGLLNQALLEEALASENVHVYFTHKLMFVDFDARVMSFRDDSAERDVSVPFDFCVGADGSYSAVRRQMMRVVRMNYQQYYIQDEYIELELPAGRDVDGKPAFQLDPNHLHIWPRHSFMLVALPNQDKSFTCTLFAPSSELSRLTNEPHLILPWFRLHFPDAVEIMGEDALIHDFTSNPCCPLICTKSAPYHYLDRAVLLGDAAHSMVPFYGQGLNCGLEDVRVLDILLRQEGVDPSIPVSRPGVDDALTRALDRYTESRHKDVTAICDLAMDNYTEMRHLVTLPMFLFKKALDNLLYSLTKRRTLPFDAFNDLLSHALYGEAKGWLPLYTMVTFRPDINYATAQKRVAHQSRILTLLGWTGTAMVGMAGFLAFRSVRMGAA